MRINALRKELADLLGSCPADRTPALRRSLREEWLYSTDIPALISPDRLRLLRDELSRAGWECAEEGGRLELRKPAGEPPEGWFEGTFGPEAACCLSLLERHAGDAGADPEAAERLMIKAGEEGEKALESACGKLHREWAERLRKREPLPAISRGYFGYGKE